MSTEELIQIIESAGCRVTFETFYGKRKRIILYKNNYDHLPFMDDFETMKWAIKEKWNINITKRHPAQDW